ncbi:MAG: multicopper oxidase domain-containing protein [Nitrospina sp.]|jgi:FtsP/CotA-like multicopper oxidase with cupredoxin domain|nr:multicopper oxidase domain-containing protein [Nitrospina sp.]MBT3874471.1 multicopper oxidase domain-containing protein [Nitrospina sp.]MBT4049103.1 multicopper oxidase domain-containing protein [Nitrospina sp.]MBT4559141.1 multicopper oxidase domain-containing protein [Nitrospina sp.]MBT5347807.1 multicopper oxidase domain-containing protein [Nitrospina sp.]
MKRSAYFLFIILTLSWILVPSGFAAIVEYELNISYKTLNVTGKDVKAMSLNDSIPGPTLRFREGDTARIRLKNSMDVPTSVHWHGILLPYRQDGVPYVTNPPIKPGETQQFEFPIKQAGTYWFHSHTGLQEQRGVYGSIVITPKDGERVPSDQDKVIVLSDWTNENPDEILRTLKSGSDYYSFKKGSLQSLVGAVKDGALTDVFKRSLMRMPPMDVSDVAYDAFLANGKKESTIPAKPGEKVRLRFINSATATYFHLQFAGGPVQIVSADGIDVEPVNVDRFLMAIAETYDLIVTVPENGSYEFRATAQDGSSHSSIFIGSGKRILAPSVPKPNLYKMKMSMGNSGMKMKGMSSKMKMPMGMDKKMGIDSMTADNERPLSPYKKLRSVGNSSLPKKNPTREVVLTLTGDMERYIWSINGEILSADNMIRIRHGENVRFVLINKTMMHHPMHLHGHFFRVINGQGDYSPLKHTVDVPPLATQIIEFEANEYNDWFFHCHILYHAKSGMARVVSYEDKELDVDLKKIRHRLYKDSWNPTIIGTAQSHMTDGVAVLSNSKNILSATWQVGWQNVDKTEQDVELAYDRYFNRFLNVFGGINLTNDYERGILGIRYLLPFNIDSTFRFDSEGEFRVELSQGLQLTSRFEVFGDVEYDTESKEEWLLGGKYIFSKNMALTGQYHSDFGAGAGLEFRY